VLSTEPAQLSKSFRAENFSGEIGKPEVGNDRLADLDWKCAVTALDLA
jgi:hypothetical protein